MKKKKVIGYMNYCPGIGIKKDDEPCASFDDCPQIMTPYEASLKLLAGGEAQELRHRATYYDTEEFEQWKDEYACDYIQRYNDYLQAKKGFFLETQAASAPSERTSGGEVSDVSETKSKETSETSSTATNSEE